MKLTLRTTEQEASDIFSFVFEPERPLRRKAGQYWIKNATAKRMAVVRRIAPPHIVALQAKTFMPVGTAIIMLVAAKNKSIGCPRPTANISENYGLDGALVPISGVATASVATLG